MSSLSSGLGTGGVIAKSSFPYTRTSNSPLLLNKLVGWDRDLKRVKINKKKDTVQNP